MEKIRIGIYGIGNLGRGAELAVEAASDMELAAAFTRRDPSQVKLHNPSVPVVSADQLAEWKDKIDVLLVCGGSANDLPHMTPELAKSFCVIDSFDTHAKIPQHFDAVDVAAKEGNTLALISCGWDPGLFSLARVLGISVLPQGSTYTFWGKGVSQGHSDAIRHIPGVVDARQYTVPCEDVMDEIRAGKNPQVGAKQMHTRDCYVVLAPDADPDEVRRQIVTMPNYFEGYETTVHFISQEEMAREHNALPHGGSVIRSGNLGANQENKATVEFRLTLDSNPEFTSSVLTAYARAVYRMHKRGRTGCITVMDVAPGDLADVSAEELRAHYL